ncbi:inositol monophosphatase [Rhizobium deserti]|uniref:Inositol-1-monophosphatase n=1 Tax=Rhizobium deserti TaxID=2547961 RepID=A0A4R5UA02_9HYPH|nr:inositol monophosphatase family protein [Rhizobium deserti]TDK31312.1 inositol monophosphatase [Rhizobium deserti]
MTSLLDANALQRRLESAISVARHVGERAATLRAQAQPGMLEVESKGLQDFVTVVDKEAEATIRQALLGAFPNDSFMGEEGGGLSGSAGTWVVDPIDGTTNYIRGFRHWGVSIAFIAGGEILIGVIYDATQNKVFHAVRGKGAFKDDQPISVASTTDPARAIVILGHSRRTEFEEYLAVSRRLYERGIDYRRMGAAAIGLVRVAEGISDLYYERHLAVWDMLAGILIASEAGATVAVPPLDALLHDGGPVVACSPGLAGEFAFLMEFDGMTTAAE